MRKSPETLTTRGNCPKQLKSKKLSELQRKREKCITQSAASGSLSTKGHHYHYRLLSNMNLSLNRTSWVHLFTCKRFHVLLNSLFKVLCNFPSRYLFAIGLTVIFSLRWSLPPTLGCTLKQPDSKMPYQCSVPATLGGLHPLWLEWPYSKGFTKPSLSRMTWHQRGTVSTPERWDLHAGLFPFHSPLLRESHLLSFPRLNYMLKSGRYSYFIWGRKKKIMFLRLTIDE